MSRLLIADDEPAVRTLVRMTLDDAAYEIIEASDGREALRLAREERPDVILMDVMMPGLTGLEVCKQLKQDPDTAGIVVIMLTAMTPTSKEPIEHGPDDYLTKPFSPLTLIRKVDEFVSSALPAGEIVLLIDDEPQMQDLVSLCLGETTARVVRAANLADAIRLARRARPRVVLLDLALGDEDGLAILPTLREEPALSGVPVVAFSIHDDRREEALQSDVEGFVAKPFKAVGLKDVLQPYLG